MPIPTNKGNVVCYLDHQYRWMTRTTKQGSEVHVQLNEIPDGQMLIAKVPRLFKEVMVLDIIEHGPEMGWDPTVKGPDITCRLTKGHLIKLEN
ncbi:hypothetical protein [Persicirhabdus sediminis]|uniref:Uncharacterized protein n=1 Tax=Persicirhabdus sediminis TaxID=454144 RepID=A0A8J7MFM3_9BACT|nr:hypothetical protein [Persicirhabdus sediminis]MBK1791872.1 hypothetical protein [Persicirhabdus sediminis]